MYLMFYKFNDTKQEFYRTTNGTAAKRPDHWKGDKIKTVSENEINNDIIDKMAEYKELKF